MKPAELLPQCVELRQKVVKMPGVYLIYCETSGMGYVGSSQHVYRRLHAHVAQLNGKRHSSPHLQAAWSKYGRAAFKLLLLEARTGTSEELLALENAYLMAIDRELLFNTTVPAVMGREHGFKHSDETRAKMAASHKGKKLPYVKRSPEAVAAHVARMTGRPASEKRKAAISAAHKLNPPNAKLNHEIVVQIRADFETLCAAKGGKPFYGVYAQIALKYEISGSQAERICKRQAWA